MQKILIIGSGGAGKSTFARRLGERLKLEVIHLDRLYWKPGWIERPKDEWRKIIQELLSRDAWIIDGNYSGTFAQRMAECDTVIFLDIARSICLWRVLKRTILYRRSRRPDMAEGCPERFDLSFMVWVWNYKKRTRPKIVNLLMQHSQNKKVIWLRTQAEVERFLVNPQAA